ncbi:protein-glutamate O-methyltransferase CheR [Phormidium yuhuli AB48]|uniref:Protein-glutamate O-methyltransferase CheR n=1 Tax=Phormidium yuhuli AB48 TaxID=2940671 RepID=A0ABY5ATW8_9CYAN|nr:protein-glutamate O-methyltransferase CheR [Phormidium yuhuli]USR92670.1 protein-glutamate O-methyltransferase CheR [Phormidium yuhuli AB48]
MNPIPQIPSETSFFRDFQVFEGLRRRIFPELFRRNYQQQQLNIWSAACSRGQEAYSLAMLLYDAFPLMVDRWTIQILASDISDEVLHQARAGVYSNLDVKRRLPKRFRERYFHCRGNHWVICDEIRLMVQFRRIDLCQPLPSLPPMDLILLRNLLIYFEVPQRTQILNRLHPMFKPQGYLVLGASETLTQSIEGFRASLQDEAMFYEFCPLGDAFGGDRTLL